MAQTVKRLPATWETRVRSLGWERSSGVGNGNPLQYSCLGNPMGRGAWWATVHGVTKSWTRLSTQALTHTLTDITKKQQILLHNYILTSSCQNTPTKYEGKVSLFENRSQRRTGGETKPPSGPVTCDFLRGAHGRNGDSQETCVEDALRFFSGSWPGELSLPHVS